MLPITNTNVTICYSPVISNHFNFFHFKHPQKETFTMKRSYVTSVIVFASVALLFATSLPSIAASFSGRVVDEDGQPVEGLIIALPSFPGNTPPDPHHHVQVELPEWFEGMFPPAPPSETDATGAFSIRNIATPSVSRLTLFPERNSDYEMLSCRN